ncbi:hypothetical protein D3C85_1926200 [compost metagenome]
MATLIALPVEGMCCEAIEHGSDVSILFVAFFCGNCIQLSIYKNGRGWICCFFRCGS